VAFTVPYDTAAGACGFYAYSPVLFNGAAYFAAIAERPPTN